MIAYDDSDGWYDHQMGPIVSRSQDAANDGLYGKLLRVARRQGRRRLPGPLRLRRSSPVAGHLAVREGQLRLPFDVRPVIVLRFIEDNWSLGRLGNFSFDAKAGRLDAMFDFSRGESEGDHPRALILDPVIGTRVHSEQH